MSIFGFLLFVGRGWDVCATSPIFVPVFS